MSTAAPTPTPPAPSPPPAPMTLADLTRAAWGLVLGLTWAALMLLVFGLWMRSKHAAAGATMSGIFFAGAAVAAIAAGWQIFTLRFKQESPEQKTQTFTQQRQIFSYLCMGAGLGLIIMAFVLGSGKTAGGSFRFDLANFAETIGALVFGLVALAGGYVLQSASADEITNPVRFLVGKVPILKATTVVIGVACLGAFIYLSFVKKIGFEWTPELAALLCMSVLSAGCLFWLNSGTMDEDSIRLFVLVYGGATGLIMFFLSLGRMYQWGGQILGIANWQGPEAWRFWLCAYLFFAALMLMFLCFNLARADVRSNANLRRLMYGYDAIAQSLLLLGILFEINVVIYAWMPFTYDWTSARGTYALSDSTKNLVTGLKKEVHIIALMREGDDGYKDLRVLLDNMAALNSNLKTQFLNPNSSFEEYEKLAKKFRQIQPDRTGVISRGVLLVNGSINIKEGENVPHTFISDRKLVEQRPAMGPEEKPKILFKGESEILKELRFLLQDRTKRKIYILQGDDEPSISKMEGAYRLEVKTPLGGTGIAAFVDKLKQDNFEVSGLSFQPELPGQKSPDIVFATENPVSKRKEVPEDCHTLIIAGASKQFSNDSLEAIRTYIDRGNEKSGKVLVFLDVFTTNDFTKFKETGLEGLLGKYGVEVGNDIPLQVIPPSENPLNIIATPPLEAQNSVAKAFANDVIIMYRGVRSVQPSKGGGDYKAETILHTHPRTGIVAEKNLAVLRNPPAYVRDLLKDQQRLAQAIAPNPVSVAVAVSKGDRPFMVVFGDTEFIDNVSLRRSETSREAYDFVASSIEWMSGREAGVGAKPKEQSIYTLKKGALDNAGRMILLPFWLMTLFVVGLGMAIWIVRRR